MKPPETRPDAPAATHLLYRNHADEQGRSDVEEDDGMCCFCGHHGPGLPASEAISHKYFSDYDLMQTDTGHVCAACAYCMNQRSLKNGHWIAAANRYDGISTGDLPEYFEKLRDGAYEPPVAVHLTSSPIQSFHAYLWTPVQERTAPIVLDFDRETVRFEWDEFDVLLAAVEDFRWHGFTLDEIRSGEPRVQNLDRIGIERYQRVDAVIDPHRRSPLLEVAITLSQSASDQGRGDLPDGTLKLDTHV